VLNCVDPAPVASRHLVGHFLPSLLFDALRPALGDRLPAASADALWMMVWRGVDDDERDYTLTTFGAGGSGGRPDSDGLTTTGFPTGVRAAPTEVLETLTPLVQVRREIRPDSAGGGRHRGGLGQVVEVRNRADARWSVNANIDRVVFPAPGALGGLPGATGTFTDSVTGDDLPRKTLVRLSPSAHVRLAFPGGGGYGDPHERPVDRVLDDVVNGYVGVAAAREVYGVEVAYVGDPDAVVRPPESYRVDEERTAQLRAGVTAPG
jgi:N-methylhydantoinase B